MTNNSGGGEKFSLFSHVLPFADFVFQSEIFSQTKDRTKDRSTDKRQITSRVQGPGDRLHCGTSMVKTPKILTTLKKKNNNIFIFSLLGLTQSTTKGKVFCWLHHLGIHIIRIDT